MKLGRKSDRSLHYRSRRSLKSCRHSPATEIAAAAEFGISFARLSGSINSIVAWSNPRWHCQSCGAMMNLEVHHKEFRRHSGSDIEENLITLCSVCHASVHGQMRLRADG